MIRQDTCRIQYPGGYIRIHAGYIKIRQDTGLRAKPPFLRENPPEPPPRWYVGKILVKTRDPITGPRQALNQASADGGAGRAGTPGSRVRLRGAGRGGSAGSGRCCACCCVGPGSAQWRGSRDDVVIFSTHIPNRRYGRRCAARHARAETRCARLCRPRACHTTFCDSTKADGRTVRATASRDCLLQPHARSSASPLPSPPSRLSPWSKRRSRHMSSPRCARAWERETPPSMSLDGGGPK